jgi:hypothetical protein
VSRRRLARSAKAGKIITSTNPACGFSRESDGVVLFLFTWSHNDMGVDMASDSVKVTRLNKGPLSFKEGHLTARNKYRTR